MPLLEETPLLAPDGMVTLTALKWTGVSPSVGNLVEATTVRVAAGAGGGVWPAAEAASAAAHTRKLPIVVARMWPSLNKFIRIAATIISRRGVVTPKIALVHAAVRAACGKIRGPLARQRRLLAEASAGGPPRY